MKVRLLVLTLVCCPLLHNAAEAQTIVRERIPFNEKDAPRDYVIHATDRISEHPDIREAYDRYLQWHRDGRPGFEQRAALGKVLYDVGMIRDFKVLDFESLNGTAEYDDIAFELRAVGDFSLIWVEQDEWAAGNITQPTVDRIMQALEEETSSNSYDPSRGIISIEREIFPARRARCGGRSWARSRGRWASMCRKRSTRWRRMAA
jgi:hypothetical protein